MKKYISALILLTSHLVLAGSIKTVKGTQVLINLEGSTFTEGQQVMAKDAAGKNRALLKIKKAGQNQALAEIVKGKVEVGYTVGSSRAPAAVNQSSGEFSDAKLEEILRGTKWGVLGSYVSSSMNARYSLNSVNKTANMSGTGFGVLGYYDMPFSETIEFRALGGLEQFSAKQTHSEMDCDSGNSNVCSVSINYLSMYGLAKYKFSHSGKNHIWGAGGFGYLMAMSKSSTVLDVGTISSNQVLTLSLGADIGLKSGILPISIDYSIFPASSTVTASMMAIRGGWAWGL